MGRRARRDSPVDWHVFNRGSRRMALFRDDQDAQIFLSLLFDAAEASGCVLWAYLLMTNHFHLALRGSSDQLSLCMGRTGRLYARYHNRRYNLTGAAFEGRYEAFPQASFPLLLRTIAYIFVNPVAAGMVKSPGAHPWSSYKSFRGEAAGPLRANESALLRRLDPDTRRAREKFGLFLDRELRRLKKGPSAPQAGLSARDIQATHFAWLLEEAGAKTPFLEGWEPVLLAIYWAQQAGFHRSAISTALGKGMNSGFRKRLSDFREWITRPGHDRLAQIP